MLFSSSLTRAFGSGYRRAQGGLTGDLLLYHVEEGDAYFVGNLMSGMARCAKDMALSAGSGDVIRAGKTPDGRVGAALRQPDWSLSLDASGPSVLLLLQSASCFRSVTVHHA